ncbi:hypothetical protein KA005_74475 [bacterium]|nr:hypothetical protein [bacterium]
MKKRKTWRSKLTKKELKHLKEDAFESGTRLTLAVLEHTFRVQADMRKQDPTFEPCWTCKAIARKLGFEI